MAKTSWTIEDSAATYNLKGWGLKHFGINEDGNLVVYPRRTPDRTIDIKRVVDDVVSRGIKLPVLVRFQDVLRHRVEQLNRAFAEAISEFKYGARYMGVYPIKVNQLREVVEEILDAGEPFQYGLEAGSKGELMAVIAMNGAENLTVVNGYKDESVMRLAAVGLKMGKKVIVVVEKLNELAALVKTCKEMGVRPLIGLRCRLQTQGSGKWRGSTGDAAKFGLTTPDILRAVQDIKSEGLCDCVKLLHFHIGSQITDIQAVKDAVKEGARMYAKLRKMGLALEYVDCGGGLGVDYDGTHTTGLHSMNYTLREYVSGVVYTMHEVCKQEKVPEPNIVTESGRSIVAHHSLLVVNVFGSIEAGSSAVGIEPVADEHEVVREMRDTLEGLSPRNIEEAYHDAQQRREEAYSMFKLGYLSMEERAKVESIYWRTCLEIQRLLPRAKFVSDELAEMTKSLTDQYLCNFSLFQSVPDAWAIGQVFPVMPLHRLTEEPTRPATLVDITCDSDGKISQYVGKRNVSSSIQMHPLNEDPYYLAVFLVGAYQASMGDIHNLFGRVNEVHVFEDAEEPGGYYVEEVIHGQTVRDVLASIQYSEFELARMVKSAIDVQVKAGNLKPREGVDLLNQYEAVMQEYTYIDHEVSTKPEPAAHAKAHPPVPAAHAV
ncbi:MAG: biosynthetic arginine decarboxylase [Elusimicrobia bacterium]|nr:biosynthetic arginine decarboxylase [Elusimicrobiota bacterium]